jgi:hypothetical protein
VRRGYEVEGRQTNTKGAFESNDIAVGCLPLEIGLKNEYEIRAINFHSPAQLDPGNIDGGCLDEEGIMDTSLWDELGRHTQNKRFWCWTRDVCNGDPGKATVDAIDEHKNEDKQGCRIGHGAHNGDIVNWGHGRYMINMRV